MGGAGDESTAVSKGSMETKETIFQLNQEIQKLRKELQTQVSLLWPLEVIIII